jgi:DNA mismatch repair ATPase MutS
MIADRASFAELGMLPDATGVWPLAALLDHTHARPAHDALKRLIAAPLATAEAITARQALLPMLAELAPLVPWSDLQSVAVQVEQGLTSNYVVAPASRTAMARFALKHGDIITFAEQQVRAVDRLLSMAEPINTRLQALVGDEQFATVQRGFEVALSDDRRRLIAGAVAEGRTWRLAMLDSVVREGARDGARVARDAPPVVPFRDHLRALIDAIWQLDAFCSLAVASRRMGDVRPTLAASDRVPRFVGLRHPALRDGVATDLPFGEAERVCFLTGPNMAGKSTLLRAMGIAVHCAHLGLDVAAEEAVVPLYDRLLVSITVRDNLARGESLYLAEIRRVKAVVQAVVDGESVLAMLDEVFRGTNVKDASAATSLLVDGLSCAARGTFVIASHLSEVGETRTARRGMGCWRMGMHTDGDAYRFTYRAEPGVSSVHLGMRLLDAEGVGGMLRAMAAG